MIRVVRTVALVVALLALTVGVNVVIGVAHPSRIPILVLAASLALIFAAKGLGVFVARPVGSRPGEVADEAAPPDESAVGDA